MKWKLFKKKQSWPISRYLIIYLEENNTKPVSEPKSQRQGLQNAKQKCEPFDSDDQLQH